MDKDLMLMLIIVAMVLLVAIAVTLPDWLRKQGLIPETPTRSREKATIAACLQDGFRYYQLLPFAEDKQRFVDRVYTFAWQRSFNFEDIEPSDRIRWLISAAAVQLTFGLKNYHLSSFQDIHIMRQDYRHLFFDKPLEGHITHGHIYFSWHHFQAGFAVPDNMQNVGLHELAHALAHECFNEYGGGDRHFKDYFYRYSAVARPIYYDMREGKTNMLGAYAATNFDEFWAVSVEAFFEKPGRMQAELPELFDVMCRLLRQNPLAMSNALK